MFKEQASHNTDFGSYKYQVNSGSTIVKTGQGHYQIKSNDDRAPIPIHMVLKDITLALDPRLWTHLPERDQTYESLTVAGKLRNLIQALTEYPAWSRAPTSVGMLSYYWIHTCMYI